MHSCGSPASGRTTLSGCSVSAGCVARMACRGENPAVGPPLSAATGKAFVESPTWVVDCQNYPPSSLAGGSMNDCWFQDVTETVGLTPTGVSVMGTGYPQTQTRS